MSTTLARPQTHLVCACRRITTGTARAGDYLMARNALREGLDRGGLTELGAGSYRQVFRLTPGFAVKVLRWEFDWPTPLGMQSAEVATADAVRAQLRTSRLQVPAMGLVPAGSAAELGYIRHQLHVLADLVVTVEVDAEPLQAPHPQQLAALELIRHRHPQLSDLTDETNLRGTQELAWLIDVGGSAE